MQIEIGTLRHELVLAALIAGMGIGCGGEAGDGGGAADAGDPPGCIGSWSPIVGNLTPRRSHSVIGNGTELLVWGGIKVEPENTYANYADGARFDPKSNTFKLLPATGAPRHGALTAWQAGELVIFGGLVSQDNNGPYPVLDGFRMDITTGAVTPIPEPPITGSMLWPVLFVGDVLFAGDFSFQTAADSWCRWSPSTPVWECESAPSFALGSPGGWLLNPSFVVGGGEFYTWGGSTDGLTNPQTAGFRHSPETETWSAMSTSGAPEPRLGPALAWLEDRLLVYGGFVDGRPQFPEMLADGGFYDPKTDTWTPMAPLPMLHLLELSAMHAIVRAGERVVIWSHWLAEGAVYDMASSTWTELCRSNAMPAGNWGASLTWTGSEVVVLGGDESTHRIGARLTLP